MVLMMAIILLVMAPEYAATGSAEFTCRPRAVSLYCGMSLTRAEIVEQIVAKGAQLRSERESASSDGAATLQQLLDLKAQFKALTGAEYRARSSKSAKRARASAAARREAESNRVDPSNPDAPSKRRKQPGVSQMWRDEVFVSLTHPFPPYVTPHFPYISQAFIF